MAEEITDSTIITCMTNYRAEAGQARKNRLDQNRLNFDTFHLRQDWSYKQNGMSREFLPKQAMAVEQCSNFLQQGLADNGDWFRVETQPGVNEDALLVKPKYVYLLMERQLSKCGFINIVGDAAKLGLLGSLMIAKVSGKYVTKPKYVAKTELKNGSYKKRLLKMDDKAWQLDISLVRQEDYYPDPTGRGMYEMQDIYMDYYEVERLAKGKDAIYDLEAVKQLKGSMSSQGIDKEYEKSRETGQDTTNHGYRHQIKLTEIWGNILNEQGELIYENVMCTVANDTFVIQKPIPNPYWHGESPFVACPIIRVPHSVWHKALMDAPSMLNRALNDMFNLTLDGGMMAVHGIKQIHKNYLEDPEQVNDGIPPGTTLMVTSSLPPGTQVLERVDTSTVPQDAMAVMGLLQQELNMSTLTNDLRMGASSAAGGSATAIVEASQSISAMFTGMAKQIEGDDGSGFITPVLEKAWKVIAQNMDDLDSNEVKALLGNQGATKLLAMGNEEIFADTVQGTKFQTFGISANLNKQKDFTKLTAFLQTVGSSEPMMEAFLKKYDFTKYLTEIMRSLDINPYKIEADKDQGGDLSQQPPGMAPGEMPNDQSQIPQAGAAGNQGDMSATPQTSFDGVASRATPAGG